MKIMSNDQVPQTLQHESKNKARPSGHKEFGAILEETLENSKTVALAPMRTTFANRLPGVQPALAVAPDQQFAINSIEGMINLLDRYCEKLADPRITLKKVDPVIKEMSRELENLAPVLDSLPDDELKNILNRTLVTASLEISKFYRGDYISA